MKSAINTGGVKPFPIEGRMFNERERLLGMTKEERAWRMQWLKDQELSPEEPRFVPELYKELYNPIRRFYRKPLDYICTKLIPTIGIDRALIIRGVAPKILMLIGGVYLGHYYFKYNANDWTKKGGFTVSTTRPVTLPGAPNYHKLNVRTQPEDYADGGFKNRTVLRDN